MLIIEFRPGRKVRVKYATSVYHKSQKEVMIIGEGIGYETKEVVTKYLDIKEGDYYHYDCQKRRKELMEVGFYNSWPLVDYDQWYPGSPKNKMKKREIESENK